MKQSEKCLTHNHENINVLVIWGLSPGNICPAVCDSIKDRTVYLHYRDTELHLLFTQSVLTGWSGAAGRRRGVRRSRGELVNK